jgi:hypothetical protein
MFGNNDEDQNDQQTDTTQTNTTVEPTTADSTTDTPAVSDNDATADGGASAGDADSSTSTNDTGSDDTSVVGSDPINDTPALVTPPVEEPVVPPAPTEEVNLPSIDTTTPSAMAPAAGSDDLLGIKQQALEQLSPLIDQLDQTPEEKFRTTMMMIQASDNQSLIKNAYEAAKNITDEKARAQALLDIINEINYFTQHNA